jgi:hypothetical protein
VPVPPRRTRRADFPQRAPQVALVRLAVIPSLNEPVLAVERRLRQLFPAAVTPALESIRPDPPHDPGVESVEEPSDVGAFVVLAPPTQKRIQILDQLLGGQGHTPLRALPYLLHETTDRLLARVRIRVKRLLGMASTRWICAEWDGASKAANRKKE